MAVVVCCDCAGYLLCAVVRSVVVLMCGVVCYWFGWFGCSGLVCLFAGIGVLGGVWFGGLRVTLRGFAA